jgi:hypothetical protein
MPHIHHVKNNPSQMRHVVPGSMPEMKEVAITVPIAKEMPPSTKMA